MGGDDVPDAADTAGENKESRKDGSDLSPPDVSQRQIDEFFPAAAMSATSSKSKKRRARSSASDAVDGTTTQGPTVWEQTAQTSIRLHKRRALLLKRLEPLQAELSAVETEIASIATTKILDTAQNLSLVEVWSLVFRYLTYADMVQATAAWKFLLKEVAPLVEGICIDRPREFGLLSPAVAAERFPKVEEINYRGRDQREEVKEASECPYLVPFLCTCSNLFSVDIETLWLSKDANDEILEDICESYKYGDFCSKWIVNIHGISCLVDEEGNDDEECPLCRSVCASFPARGVANANFAESSDCCWHDYRNGTLGYMCISYEDGIKILASAYYGQNYIKSDEAILDAVANLAPYSKNEQGILDLYSGDIKHFEPLEPFRVSFTASKISTLKKHGARPEKVDREIILGHLYKHAPGRIGEAYFYRCDFDELVEAGLPLKETDFILVDNLPEVLKRKGLLPRDD